MIREIIDCIRSDYTEPLLGKEKAKQKLLSWHEGEMKKAKKFHKADFDEWHKTLKLVEKMGNEIEQKDREIEELVKVKYEECDKGVELYKENTQLKADIFRKDTKISTLLKKLERYKEIFHSGKSQKLVEICDRLSTENTYLEGEVEFLKEQLKRQEEEFEPMMKKNDKLIDELTEKVKRLQHEIEKNDQISLENRELKSMIDEKYTQSLERQVESLLSEIKRMESVIASEDEAMQTVNPNDDIHNITDVTETLHNMNESFTKRSDNCINAINKTVKKGEILGGFHDKVDCVSDIPYKSEELQKGSVNCQHLSTSVDKYTDRCKELQAEVERLKEKVKEEIKQNVYWIDEATQQQTDRLSLKGRVKELEEDSKINWFKIIIKIEALRHKGKLNEANEIVDMMLAQDRITQLEQENRELKQMNDDLIKQIEGYDYLTDIKNNRITELEQENKRLREIAKENTAMYVKASNELGKLYSSLTVENIERVIREQALAYESGTVREGYGYLVSIYETAKAIVKLKDK